MCQFRVIGRRGEGTERRGHAERNFARQIKKRTLQPIVALSLSIGRNFIIDKPAGRVPEARISDGVAPRACQEGSREKCPTPTPTRRQKSAAFHVVDQATTNYALRGQFSPADHARHPTGCKSTIDPPTLPATAASPVTQSIAIVDTLRHRGIAEK